MTDQRAALERDGPYMDVLRALARLHGLEVRHRDGEGREVEPSAASLSAVLGALRVDVAGPADARRALGARRAELRRRLLEPVSVIWSGGERMARRGPALRQGERVWARLVMEDGREHRWKADVGRRGLTIPVALPLGYHRLEVSTPAGEAASLLIVSPPRAYGAPGDASPAESSAPGAGEWGVFLPLHALRTDRSRGVGDLRDLRGLLHWVSELGGGAVGILPIFSAYLSDPLEPSPYAPVSRLFWNEIFLDPEGVPEWERTPEARELVDSPGFQDAVRRLRTEPLVDYPQVQRLTVEVLDHLAAEWHRSGGDRSESFRTFLADHRAAPSYAAFRATCEARGTTWDHWPRDWRRGGIPPSAFGTETYRRHLYAQLRFEEQLGRVAAEAPEGCGLYLDLPLGAHGAGFDTWANPALFATGVEMGAPPDAFQENGQRWGLAPMRPEVARESGHRHFRAVLRTILSPARWIRIDHVMSLHRLFWIPEGMTPAQGVYVRNPPEEMYAILCLESHRHRTVIVGEDLGTVPDEVPRDMQRHGLRRMFVVPFELDPHEPGGMSPVPEGALACLNTHDLPTFRGSWEDEQLRDALRKASGVVLPAGSLPAGGVAADGSRTAPDAEREEGEGDAQEAFHVMEGLLDRLGRSGAGLVLANLEDLWLEESPQNVPGVERPQNWRRKSRLSFAELTTDFRVLEVLRSLDRARKGQGDAGGRRRHPGQAELAPETPGEPAPETPGEPARETRGEAASETRGEPVPDMRGEAGAGPAEWQAWVRGAAEDDRSETIERSEENRNMAHKNDDRDGGPATAPVSLLTDDDLHLFNEGTHRRLYRKLGAHLGGDPERPATTFSVWAPSAEAVSVVGDFNDWDPDAHPLSPRGSSGIWEGRVEGVGQGAVYKYDIRSRNRGYRVQKADPFGFRHEVPPATASVVWDLSYDWRDGEWMSERGRRNDHDAPISVYEMHLGSWRRDPADPHRLRSYREVAPELATYVSESGFTHVEFLPLMEHPFYGSWGYQTTGYFAPSSRYGSPQDLMFLIDELHRAGIGVILDWVPSHFPSDEHGLGYFDGTHLFEHEDPRQGFHPDWESLIFNFGRDEVRSFLLSSALFWLDAYHVDGIRVDAVASMLYLDYSRKEGEWIPNRYGGRENLEAIGFLRSLNEAVYSDYPDTQTVAEESTAWPMVSRPTYLGGLGFGMKWDMGWMHDTLQYLAHDPVHRRHHHHQLTFRGLYAFNENFMLPLSHDEVVHGKGSLLGRMPGDHWQKRANLRLLLANQFAQPGKKLLFMGGEMGQWTEWNHDGELDWALLEQPAHAGIRRLVTDLNRIYREEPSLHEGDFAPEGFEWISTDDAENSVVSFLRKPTQSSEAPPIAAIFNLTPVSRENYRVGVPLPGRWTEVVNTDAAEYGGSGLGNLGGVETSPVGSHGHYHSLVVALPPLGALLLKGPS